MNRVFRGIGLLLCLVLFVGDSRVAAQVSTGEIFGKVTDTTGAVLPGVTVTISGPSLIQPQSVVTAESGGYRFPRIPIGTYTVAFELTGFKKTVREGIVIQAGFNAGIDVRLELSSVQETVTVTGESPVVDTKSTTLAASFSKDALERIPSARDPWVVLQMTPGMVMSGANVGGNLSGQQTSFTAMGSGSNQQWTIDGAVISDIASGNSSPTYYDFDSFEEIQITTASADASQQGSGVQVNFITRSGSNTFQGQGRWFDTNERFQGQNITDAQRAQGAGAGNPIQNIYEVGGQFGGPIARNKAWFWGAASRQNVTVGVLGFYDTSTHCQSVKAAPLTFSVLDVRDCLKGDVTTLTNYNGKFQYQEATGHKSSFTVTFGDKYRGSRGSSVFRPLITTVVQTGPTIFYRGEHQWIASSRLSITAQYLHIHEDWFLRNQNPGLADIQPINWVDTSYFDRSNPDSDYHTIRPQDDLRADANYFLSGVLGGDHSIKFGGAYRHSPVENIDVLGGGAIARLRGSYADGTGALVSATGKGTCTVAGVTHAANTPDGCNEANIVRDGYGSYILYAHNAYLNDSWKIGRTTINLGVRFDRQYDIARATTIAANRVLPTQLPAINFAGADSGARYSNWSPRFGVTYDLSGDGKTVLKASGSRYFGLGMNTAGTLQPTGQTTLRYAWYDVNRDRVVQANELDFARGFLTTPSSNYDPANPSSPTTPARVDPDLKNNMTDEAIVGIDRQVMNDFGVGAMYIYRKYHQFLGTYRTLDLSSEYTPVTFTSPCGNASCSQASYTGTYFQRATPLHAQTIRRNDGTYDTYSGIQLTARKRLSDRWMLTSSYQWNHQRTFSPQADRDYLDPTNHDLTHGHESGTRNNAHVFKLQGLYQFPWDITASAGFGANSGGPFNPTITSPNRTGGLGTASVLLLPNNTLRLPAVQILDLHVDKALRLGGQRRVSVSFDVFNIANNNVVLGRTARQDTSTANNITTVLAPRVARFGVKVNF